jgi:hypothetical protein
MIEPVTLLSSIVEPQIVDVPDSGRYSVFTFSPGGEPHADVIVTTVIADYHRVTGRLEPTHDHLQSLMGEEVTVLIQNGNDFGAQFIQTMEGTLRLDSRERLGLLGKGERTLGVSLDRVRILDCEPGYGKTPLMRQRIEQVRASVPSVQQLTLDDLHALPENASDPARIGLVVLATWRAEGQTSPGAIWLLESYQRDHDIAEGYLILRPEDGVSESGSVSGWQLLATGGRIIDPPELTFDDAVDLADLPYHEALARFITPRAITNDHEPGNP